MSLTEVTWPDVVREGLVLVPVGATEQHGPHLPLDTDAVIATAVADELAPLLGAAVTPVVAFGASGEHQSFPGTISIGTEALTQVLVELARSLSTWAGRIVFVNGHGGNLEALTAAVRQLQREGCDAGWVPCAVSGADLHAGRHETSLMLHLAPHRVRLERAVPGNVAPLTALMPQMRVGGVAAVSDNGVLGDPAGASAEEGEATLRAMVSAAYHRISLHVAAS